MKVKCEFCGATSMDMKYPGGWTCKYCTTSQICEFEVDQKIVMYEGLTKCELCGKTYKDLNGHLERMHHITKDEYQLIENLEESYEQESN